MPGGHDIQACHESARIAPRRRLSIPARDAFARQARVGKLAIGPGYAVGSALAGQPEGLMAFEHTAAA